MSFLTRKISVLWVIVGSAAVFVIFLLLLKWVSGEPFTLKDIPLALILLFMAVVTGLAGNRKAAINGDPQANQWFARNYRLIYLVIMLFVLVLIQIFGSLSH